MSEPSRPMLAAFFLGQVWNPDGEFPRTTSNFIARLIDAFLAADRFNRARLAQGFPDLGVIVTMYKDQEGGVEALQAMARTVFGHLPAGRDEWRTNPAARE